MSNTITYICDGGLRQIKGPSIGRHTRRCCGQQDIIHQMKHTCGKIAPLPKEAVNSAFSGSCAVRQPAVNVEAENRVKEL